MRAVAIEEFGGADKLRPMDRPRPRPQPGEVLIRAVAAGVNPVDCMIREGRLRDRFPHEFPLIPGWDVAGVVDELGEATTRFRKGDRVWAYARKSTVQWGCYAEFVAVAENSVAPMPAKLLYEEAAGVPLAALTAYQVLFEAASLGHGSSLLVHAASGGVGHFAVQLARDAGAEVFGTAGPANQEFVLGLGAKVAIDYTREDFRDVVRRERPQGVDVVLCSLDDEVMHRSFEVLRPGGMLVSITGHPDQRLAEHYGVHVSYGFVEPNGEQLRRLARQFDEGRLRTHVQRIFALADAAEAQTLVAQGHVRGKLVLNL